MDDKPWMWIYTWENCLHLRVSKRLQPGSWQSMTWGSFHNLFGCLPVEYVQIIAEEIEQMAKPKEFK